MKLQSLVLVVVFLTCLIGCEKIALMTTPKKASIESRSQLSFTAEKNFWATLHRGDYAGISEADKLLTAAYLKNPNDPRLAAHLGFLHIWKITERQREPSLMDDPLIVNEIILAKKYFSDAVELNPADARFQGFLGDSILIEGKIFKDQREQVRGYFQLKRAIEMWPQFNYFTAGYPMSILDPHTKQFQEGVDWQWKTLDLCAGTHVDRNNPNFSPYLSRETTQGPMRACWNSWIAPYNYEGFFMNMGDMLVKQGNWRSAIKIYHNAQLSKNYATWPYRDMLENRITHAKENVINFQKKNTPSDQAVLFNSGYGCMACHQSSFPPVRIGVN